MIRKILIVLIAILIIFTEFALTTNKRFFSRDEMISLRTKMVREQIQYRGILDKQILKAFLNVKRELFVNLKNKKDIYSNKELPIGEGQTVSKPYITAIMMSVIVKKKYKKILDIGTGSGYQAAILSELGKEVFTVEINNKLIETAKKRLINAGYENVHFKTGDGYQGWEEYAPFDGIIVTSSLNHIPPKLIEQLAIGGRMLIPVAYSKDVQELVLLEKINKNKLKKINLIPVKFGPIIRLKEK